MFFKLFIPVKKEPTPGKTILSDFSMIFKSEEIIVF